MCVYTASFLFLAAAPVGLTAQNGSPDSTEVASSRAASSIRAIPAVRVQGAVPVIDGRLDDPAWQDAPVATDFVQLFPNEGAPASESTEVRVLYDDEAIYVAFRAWDSSPDSIVGQLTRRDQPSFSDRLHVMIDSYHDRRTAFHFAVNPVGVKLDLYRYDDNAEDPGWDAVWDVATQVDSLGWTAEFRIPLSQLRFSGADVQTWGINFGRDIARRTELSLWSPLSQQEQATVSRSGELRGLENLSPPARIELLPYTVSRLARAPGNPANPFYRSTDASAQVGADLKLGITNNLTLDLTVNPDFGQVEADPAQVNLTAFETFLPERRPFFQEGAGIFRFGLGVGDGDGANESLFYSRRIGRSPQGRVPGDADWADRPAQTRILGAAKLSGKTEGGWSIGALNALTGSEYAALARGDERDQMLVEPLTNYSVLRVQRDFREGGSAIGAIGTGTFRDGAGADDLRLHRAGYAGGIDLRHRFRNNTLEFRSFVLGSHVSGSAETLAGTQRSSARYFQRPDADHVSIDETATSMQGWAGTAELWKVGGGPWQFALATQARSPGFEVNDLGFMPRADYISQVGFVGYRRTEPGTRLRNWGVNTNAWSQWTFGSEHTGLGGNVNGHFTTLGNLNGFAGLNRNTPGLNVNALRGGPALRTEAGWNSWFGFNTDSRHDVQLSWSNNLSRRSESDTWSVNTSPNVRWRPSGSTSVRMGPFLNRRVEDQQWVGRLVLDGSPHYLLGRLEQTTVGMNVRADLALSANLSLQLYAQPFISAGEFGDFKEVVDPRARRTADRFASVPTVPEDDGYRAELGSEGTSVFFGNPDFNVKQFRSNAVMRWEYRPGSTLYLVWAQGRNHAARQGEFALRDGVSDLFGERPENVFMVKLNYWLNP